MKKIAAIVGCFIICLCAQAQGWRGYADSAELAGQAGLQPQVLRFLQLAKENLPADSANSLSNIVLLRKLAEQHLRLTQYAEAGKYLEEALAVFKNWHVTLHPQYALLCDRYGRVLEATDPARAAQYYQASLDVTASLFTDSSLAFASACNSLANFYYNSAAYKKAEGFHLAAKKIKEQLLGKDDPDYARTCNNLGAVYEAMGDYEKAEPLVLEARRIRQLMPPVKAHPAYAITCANLANIYTALGQYEKAEALYLEARSIRAGLEPKGFHADYAASCNRLADFYYVTKDFEKALPLYQEALAVRAEQAGMESLDYAETCNNLATLYIDMGKFSDAEKLALQAKAIWDKSAPVESPDHAINRNNLGLLYYAMGNYPLALQYFLEARQVWQLSLGKVHPFYAENAAAIAKVYWALQQPTQANDYFTEALHARQIQVDKLFRFTSEKEKQAYIISNNNFTDEYLSFSYQYSLLPNSDGLYDRVLLNRNLILNSLMQVRAGIYESHDSLLQQQYEAWIESKKQLASLYTAADKIDSLQLNMLEEAANAAEKILANKSAGFKRNNQLPGWQQLQQQLGTADAAIEFVSFNYYNGKSWTDSILYAAVLLRKDLAHPVMIPLFEQQQLDSVWENKATGQQVHNLYTRGAFGNKLLSKQTSLYPLIWKPLENYLKGIKKIYFAPAGDLYKISFAALAVSSTQVLSDVYELQQLNSTALLGNTANNVLTVKDSLFLYGGIRYQADSAELAVAVLKYSNRPVEFLPAVARPSPLHYNYLPGTLAEVDSVAYAAGRAGFYTEALTGSSAVEESIGRLDNGGSPAVLHIATHGFFNAANQVKGLDKLNVSAIDPLRNSGLLFAGAQDRLDGKILASHQDGILTALEISTMHLPHTRLVVLSACETGLGVVQGSEGVYGLQRAFKMAGAGYLLMSLWDVGDWETARFMKLFYGQLFEQRPIEQAFLWAQQKMKNSYRASPEKWAAWILVR